MVLSRFLMLAVALIVCSGCAVSAAINQPAQKDWRVLEAGADRDEVRAELGAPISSEPTYDVFRFQEGASGWKYVRAFLYTVADVFTLGLAELITYPVEKGIMTDADRKIRVHYTRDLKVARFEDLNGKTKNAQPAQPAAATGPVVGEPKAPPNDLVAGEPPRTASSKQTTPTREKVAGAPGLPSAVRSTGLASSPSSSARPPSLQAPDSARSPADREAVLAPSVQAMPSSPLGSDTLTQPGLAQAEARKPEAMDQPPPAMMSAATAPAKGPTVQPSAPRVPASRQPVSTPPKAVICYAPAGKWANVRGAPASKAPIIVEATGILRGTGEHSPPFVEVKTSKGQIGWVNQAVVARVACR
ncbi:MAG: hypothetical protein AB1411_16525 [Nitrospirota bacterium]